MARTTYRRGALKRKRTIRRKVPRRSLRYRRYRMRSRPMRRLPISGFPTSKMVRLRYCDTVNLNAPVGGAPIHHAFRASSAYDPDFSLGGHQPKGFDEWMTVYNHYTVVGAKMTATPAQDNSTNKIPVKYGIMLTADANSITALGDYNDIRESRLGGAMKQAGEYYRYGATVKQTGLSKTYSARKFFSIRNFVGKDLYRGDDSNNPVENAYFALWACAIGSTEDPPSQAFDIEIEYIVVFTEPKLLLPS